MKRLYTGEKCTCKRGLERANCPRCEGTGKVLNFKAMREAARTYTACPMCGHEYATELGTLGATYYVRCRACGWNYRREPEPEPET